jgi:predicted nucleic acid-binding protein
VRVLFDTSVLVAALVESHPSHRPAFAWIRRAKAREFTFLVASHTLAELYAVLSTLPVRPRIPPATAWRLVNENVEATADVIALSAADYSRTLRDLAERGLSGGVIYDALVARAADKAKADRLLTLNPADFLRVWPPGEEARITSV